eukprot:GILI01006746.1.p2 GENE.GILI01006746.1~~GILI01006746.1.p2  ORF type:complete len:189 (-),score=29.07 GILI01006746.1:60-626(-)
MFRLLTRPLSLATSLLKGPASKPAASDLASCLSQLSLSSRSSPLTLPAVATTSDSRSFATLRQVLKGCRKEPVKKTNVPALDGCPQKKGLILKVFTMTPKKPNSAIRKVVRVKLSNGKKLTAYVPGVGHTLQNFNNVLVRGGRANDLPGVRYKCVRGKYDFFPPKVCGKSRSKYGKKLEKEEDGDKKK